LRPLFSRPFVSAAEDFNRSYPNLDALVDKGLVEKSEVDGHTNAYTLTDRAVRELKARRE
jgi:DNA-binding PadR family transcriptional regulator